MKSSMRRIVSVAAMLMPLAGASVLLGCDSPTGPKYPDPIEKPDTVTNDNEGATGRGVLGNRPLPVSEMKRVLEQYRCTTVEACR